MFLTTSKDTTLKVFHLASLLQSSQSNFKLARSKNSTKYLFQLNYSLFGTYANDSS